MVGVVGGNDTREWEKARKVIGLIYPAQLFMLLRVGMKGPERFQIGK